MENILQTITIVFFGMRPIKSLRLTELAVDDLTRSKQPVTIGRATVAAPQRQQFSSGPLSNIATTFIN